MSHIFKYYTNKWNSFDFDKSNLKDEMTWDDFNKLSKNVKLKLIQINKNKIDNNNSTYTLSTRKEPQSYLSKWYEYNKKLTDIQVNLIDEYLKQSGDIDNNRRIINESNTEYKNLSIESEKISNEISELKGQKLKTVEEIKKLDEEFENLDEEIENTDINIQFYGKENIITEDLKKEKEQEKQKILLKKDELTSLINENDKKIIDLTKDNDGIIKKMSDLSENIKNLEEKVAEKYKTQDMTKYKKYIKRIEDLNIEYADVVNIGSVNELNVRNIIDDLDYIKLFELNARTILKNPPKNFKTLTINKYINCGFADSEYCRKYRVYGLQRFENEKDTKNLEKSYDNYNQLGFLDDVGTFEGVRFTNDKLPVSKIYTKKEIYQIFLGEHEYKEDALTIEMEVGRINQNKKTEFNKDTSIEYPKLFEPDNFDQLISRQNNNAQGFRDWFSKKVKQTDFDPLKKDFEQHVISDNERIKNLETKLTELTDKLNSFINNNTVKPKHTLNFLNDITNKHNLKHIEPVQKEKEKYYEDDSLESKLKNVLDKRRSDISPDDEFTESDDESEDWGEGLKEIMTKADRPMFVAGLLGELKKDLEDYGIALNLSKDGQSYYLNVFNRNKKNKYGKGIIEAKEIRDKTDEPAQITYTKLKEIYGDSYN